MKLQYCSQLPPQFMSSLIFKTIFINLVFTLMQTWFAELHSNCRHTFGKSNQFHIPCLLCSVLYLRSCFFGTEDEVTKTVDFERLNEHIQHLCV